MDKLDILPRSNKDLVEIVRRTFALNLKDLHVTLIAPSGYGKSGIIQFLSRNIKEYLPNTENHLWIRIDIDNSSSIEDIKVQLCQEFKKIGSIEKFEVESIIQDIGTFLNANQKEITFIIDGYDNLFIDNTFAKEASFFIYRLLNINPNRITIFSLGSKDLRTDDLIFHNKLNEVVLQNIQWMPELSLESQEQLIIKESSIRSFELSKILMNSIIKYAYGDPTVLKELIIKCMTSENIADLLVENSIDSQQIYNELNKTVLENHYYKILKAFSSTELERFISGKFQLDDYSVNTGLIEKYELQWRFKSHLFEYFVNKKFDKSLLRNYLMNGKELYEETKTSNLQEFKNGLTGQELNMMNILIEKKNNIVSRDEIAKRIWPEDYMVEYSDWAIDKTASRLRKKVKDANVGLEIKVVKGKGYILS